jgi:hypothetical protein
MVRASPYRNVDQNGGWHVSGSRDEQLVPARLKHEELTTVSPPLSTD